MHSRLHPKKNRFVYTIYSFYLDLDEMEQLSSSSYLFKYNKSAFYSFRDSDHLGRTEKSLKQEIIEYAKANGVIEEIVKVKLLTSVRLFGYVFNPVSFYFCENKKGETLCAVAEVGNTFGELKAYFLEKKSGSDETFYLKSKKYFYVSPFLSLDSEFEFKLKVPGDKLEIFVDDYENEKKTLVTSFVGERKDLSDWSLLFYFFRYPLVTIKIISLIHIQALKLFLMKVPFIRKNENLEEQRGIDFGKNNPHYSSR